MTEDDAQRIRDAVASIAPGVWGIDIAGTVKTIGTLAAEVERLKAENAAMREIVQAVAEHNPATTEPSHGLHTVCCFCGGDSTWDDDRNAPTITHESDCVWVHARALRAQQEQ